MEDDDEFGDLYTDVLQPFASSSSSAPHPHHSSPEPSLPNLNLQNHDQQIVCEPSHSNSPAPHLSTDQTRKSTSAVSAPNSVTEIIGGNGLNRRRGDREEDSAEGVRALERGDAEFTGEESSIDDGRNDVGEKDIDFLDNDVKFDIEDEGNRIDELGLDPIIPGFSSDSGTEVGGAGAGAEASRRLNESGEGDDWDSSDSEDDLQIVLNDNNLMAKGRGGMVVDDDDEDDGGGLIIVADGNPNQAGEEQEWGESITQPAETERKDIGDSAKASGSMAAAPNIGYSNQGYHPFHSQFKYVRPGAAPMSGATTSAPGGPPGQIRPLANLTPMPGRGRGDWRPAGMKGAAAMQKGFHTGSGLPLWGNSVAGRGFGSGLEFTLPSRKTIFDVDIDSFEEKPWKYPGVDSSDFFNFDLNEETWKDYCKQLEQLRLESTMQSKIRVYESGRTEQEYDPDMPPELAVATGICGVPVENANTSKSDTGQSDLMKGSGRVRPPIPTGRAIQVEGGYGERLPSIDTRPPRIRDSDAIIEIVLQDTADDDSSAAIGFQDQPDGGEPPREDCREDHEVEDEIPRLEPGYLDGFPQDYSGCRREQRFMNFSSANIPDGDENFPFPPEELIDYSDSRGKLPRSSGGNLSSSNEERRMQGRMHGQSPRVTPSQEMTIFDNQKENSVESMEGQHNTLPSSSVTRDARESIVGNKEADLEENGTADGSFRVEKEETDLNAVDKGDTTHKDEVAERQKLKTQIEKPLLDEGDDWEDSKVARSSDNSKAKSESSRDYQRQLDNFEEEVVQDPRSVRLGNIKHQPDENEQGLHRREHNGRLEPDRNRMVLKGRKESYAYKDRHSGSAHQLHKKIVGFDWKKDRDSYDLDWARRDDDLYSRRVRNDEPRKRDRGKVRENERSDKDDSIHIRKQMDNGSCRVPSDKDVLPRDLRHRDRDDGLKSMHEAEEDYHSKRRKDEEYLRREHIDNMHGYKENGTRRRRDRDEVLDPRKRDDHQRSRDNLDDHYVVRQKDEAWLLRERGDRQRDREEWHRVKLSHEEHRSKHEKGWSSVKSGQGAEEKALVGHLRAKDEHKASEKEYQSREVMRHSDQVKKRDRIQGGSPYHKGNVDAYARGNQYVSEERQSRPERSINQSDRVANVSENQKVHEKKQKEGSRKSKEPVANNLGNSWPSKRTQEDQSNQINEKGLNGSGDEEPVEHDNPGHLLSRKQRGDISSDDERQNLRRGRSKLERWTSHIERNFGSSKSLSSLKFKDIDKDNNYGSSEAAKPVDESVKSVDADSQHLLSAEGNNSVDMEGKDAETKGLGDQHLDTVEKLKKRTEHFKLPLPCEKEALAIKKLESEPLHSAKTENPENPEVKQERPARKRRWISN